MKVEIMQLSKRSFSDPVILETRYKIELRYLLPPHAMDRSFELTQDEFNQLQRLIKKGLPSIFAIGSTPDGPEEAGI